MENQFLFSVILPVTVGGILFCILWHSFTSHKHRDLPRAIAKGLGGSKFLLTRGVGHGTTDFFFDIDLSVTNPLMLKPIVDWYVAVIEKIKNEFGKIDKLAFIEKDSGPVGSILLTGILIDRAKIPGVIVRLRRRLSVNSLKESNVKRGNQVILVSDVLTKGWGIESAVQKLRLCGYQVQAAVVLVSRKEHREIKELEDRLKIRIFYAFKATKKEDLERQPLKEFIEEEKYKKRGYQIPLNNSISV